MSALNQTHDPQRRSWVEQANARDTPFPIQNLPFGIFRRRAGGEGPRAGVAIGDQILDLAAARRAGLIDGRAADAGGEPTLNRLMALGASDWSRLRKQISDCLATDGERADDCRQRAGELLVPMEDATLELPAAIGDYTDFFTSIYHATNTGSMFRPDNPLMPNFKYVPVAYHGRASSVVVSGTPVRRPHGQARPGTDPAPRFAPSRNLDYECELGFFIGPGNKLGEPVPIERAGERIFGFCLLNDWSARDIQGWESQPLGPFLGKSFCTTISPWIVTTEALAPFRTSAFARADGEPPPLPYLASAAESEAGGLDIDMEVLIATARMRQDNQAPARLSQSNARDLYWTVAQMVAHHSSNGCNLRSGDLCGSGTVSGKQKNEFGSILELAWRGTQPITLPNGEVRRFLEDGDEIILRARCARDGAVPIGFGDCRGVVEPAVAAG
jgi:fumarylacetoacetase